MRRIFNSTSSSQKRRRFAGIAKAAFSFGALVCVAGPHHAWSGEGMPQQNLFIQPTPAPAPSSTIGCSPANAKKAAALKEKIASGKERIDGLNEKIANRKQQMEKIQPGSSQLSFANFAPDSRLYNLALDNGLNQRTIEQLTSTVNVETDTLAHLDCH